MVVISDPRWQPVVLILNRRLECQCGALAVFVSGKIPMNGKYNQLEKVDVWCQTCFIEAQEEDE